MHYDRIFATRSADQPINPTLLLAVTTRRPGQREPWAYALTGKVAGPPAHGVSEPKQQFPVPGYCSLRVLDSSSGVQKNTIYGVLVGGSGPQLSPR